MSAISFLKHGHDVLDIERMLGSRVDMHVAGKGGDRPTALLHAGSG